ncbi:MAG: hypothetical protein KME13_22625 [Myxacorys californica WJT36-NPBG1]|nr:hypothetical protein [Myxacorys californica WJT36-NPBG1]
MSRPNVFCLNIALLTIDLEQPLIFITFRRSTAIAVPICVSSQETIAAYRHKTAIHLNTYSILCLQVRSLRKLQRIALTQNFIVGTYSAIAQAQSSTLQAQNTTLQVLSPTLQLQNLALPLQNFTLQALSPTLQAQNPIFQAQSSALQAQNLALQLQNLVFQAQSSALQLQNLVFQAQNATLAVFCEIIAGQSSTVPPQTRSNLALDQNCAAKRWLAVLQIGRLAIANIHLHTESPRPSLSFP